jgi:hypothetical protein
MEERLARRIQHRRLPYKLNHRRIGQNNARNTKKIKALAELGEKGAIGVACIYKPHSMILAREEYSKARGDEAVHKSTLVSSNDQYPSPHSAMTVRACGFLCAEKSHDFATHKL